MSMEHIFEKTFSRGGEEGYYCVKCFKDTFGSYTEWVNKDCSLSDKEYEKRKPKGNRKPYTPKKIRRLGV